MNRIGHDDLELLTGIRVIDFTRVLAGPYATQILGDLGADVIKIEDVSGGDSVRGIAPFYQGGESHYFLSLNRNKRSVAVDLKDPEGRRAVLELVGTADIVIENFRPGVMDSLAIGFDVLKAVKPDLILCSISGYDVQGPLRSAPAFDLIIQARSGAMYVNGDPVHPPIKMGLPLGDLGGALWSTVAVLAALNRRNRDPSPQHVEVSLLEGLMALESYLTQLTLLTGESPDRIGNEHHSVVPYGRFKAKDGYVVIAILLGQFWERFCDAIGRTDLRDDERFSDNAARCENRKQLVTILDGIFAERTMDEWDRVLTAADVPYGPVLDVNAALEQDQVIVSGLLRTMHHPTAGEVKVVGSPIRVNGSRVGSARFPSPMLGEHTREIATSILDMTPSQIDALIADGVFTEPV